MDENARNGSYSAEIQGNILRGYRFPHARFVFVAFRSAHAGREWLKRLPVSDGAAWEQEPTEALTIAFTHAGLGAIGVRPELLGQFSDAFCAGMRSRRASTGDPDNEVGWDAVFTGGRIHAMVSLYAKDPANLDTLEAGCTDPDVEKLGVHNGERLEEDREHFGFRDGISQPVWQDGAGGWKSDVPIREFLLFRSNWNGGQSAPSDLGLQLGALGTYLVYRRLEQHVDAFRRYVRGWVLKPDHMAAKMMGRWPNGTPVTAEYLEPHLRQQPDDTNDFDFQGDDGSACPFGAHISRVNPRTRLPASPDDHRILRRGIPYGNADGVDRGLLFIALNASIENQFEFLQGSWINEKSFNGLDGTDPIAHTKAAGNFRLPHGGPSRPLQDFVELRGGEYFFVPSVRALSGLKTGEFAA